MEDSLPRKEETAIEEKEEKTEKRSMTISPEDAFIIDTMVWSFTRLNSYYNCPYEWYMHYIECNKSMTSFFGQYGSFLHKILEKYVKNELSLFELPQYYEDHFGEAVSLDAPPNKFSDIKQSYYDKGMDYLNNIDLILDDYEILGVEKKVEFKIGDCDMVGYIDLLLRDKESGKITILDHKSASLKFNKNGKISKKDEKHLLEFKRQLYLYSLPVIAEYGHVDYLEWNMFKDRSHIRIEWQKDEYDEAVRWAIDTINLIKQKGDWSPNPDFYYCHYLCGQRENGCEYKAQPKRKVMQPEVDMGMEMAMEMEEVIDDWDREFQEVMNQGMMNW